MNEQFARGRKELSMLRVLHDLRRFWLLLGKDFDAACIDDIKQAMAELERSEFSGWTKHTTKISTKRFYRWLRGRETYPREVKWIRVTRPRHPERLPEDLLIQEEVTQLIEVADRPRDRALVAVLYESGCRVGELLSLRVRDVEFDSRGARILVTGKTGPRRIRLISAAPYVADWLNRHPHKADRNSSLWVDVSGNAVGYGAVVQVLEMLAHRADIKKKVNPHNFRHSRATHLANHLTEAQMKEMFGWTRDSDMAATYVHLSGRDVDRALFKLYGIEDEPEKRNGEILQPKKCCRCELQNPATNLYCSRCGLPLDEKAQLEVLKSELERKRADEMMDQVLQDGELREMLAKRVAELLAANSASQAV